MKVILLERVEGTGVLGDEVTVKRFRRGPEGIQLLPENPDFEPILVNEHSESFSIEGLAVGLIRGQGFN
jgi:repressor LexA